MIKQFLMHYDKSKAISCNTNNNNTYYTTFTTKGRSQSRKL